MLAQMPGHPYIAQNYTSIIYKSLSTKQFSTQPHPTYLSTLEDVYRVEKPQSCEIVNEVEPTHESTGYKL